MPIDKCIELGIIWFRFAALRDTLFAVAAQELGIVWLNSSNSQKIQWFLHGVPNVEV